MSSNHREKIALAIFAALVALGALGAFAYIVIGHSWNFTATKVDDYFGRMEDYATICFDGVVDPADELPAHSGSTKEGAEAAKSSSTIDAISVSKQYSSMGASSFVIGSQDLRLYRSGAIKVHGSWRVGILSIEKRVSAKELSKKIKALKEQGPHLIVLIARSDDYLAGLSTISDVDVLIDLDGQSSSLSNLDNLAARVASPERGSVGVVLVSASKVISSKVIHDISEAMETEPEKD